MPIYQTPSACIEIHCEVERGTDVRSVQSDIREICTWPKSKRDESAEHARAKASAPCTGSLGRAEMHRLSWPLKPLPKGSENWDHNSHCDMEHKKLVKIFMMFPRYLRDICPPRGASSRRQLQELPEKRGKCHLHLTGPFNFRTTISQRSSRNPILLRPG